MAIRLCAAGGFRSAVLDSGQTLEEFARAAKCVGDAFASKIIALLVPDVLVDLMAKGAWPVLMVLQRWTVALPDGCHSQLPRTAAAAAAGHHVAPDVERSMLTVRKFEDLVCRLRSWAPAIMSGPAGDEELLAMEDAISFFESVAGSLRGDNRWVDGRAMYTSAMLLDTIRLARHTRGAPLEAVLKRAVSVAFPLMLNAAVEQMFAERSHVVPSKSTQHKARLCLDVSLMLLQQRRSSQCVNILRFAWADASPQKGRGWLLCSYDYIRQDDLIKTFVAVNAFIEQKLARTAAAEQADPAGDRDVQVEGDEEDGGDCELAEAFAGAAALDDRNHHQLLQQALRRHDCLPVGLGKGATKLADKASALLHAWSLECSSRQSLAVSCRVSIRSLQTWGRSWEWQVFDMWTMRSCYQIG